MKTYILQIVLLLFTLGDCYCQFSIMSEFNNMDSLSYINKILAQEITDLKAENKKLKQYDIGEKIILLVIGGAIGFFFTRFNKHFENKDNKRQNYKVICESYFTEIDRFNNEYSKLLPNHIKPEKPEKISNLSICFNEIYEYYSKAENFRSGEYNSPEAIQIRNYFTHESLSHLRQLASKSLSYYNKLFDDKIDESKETIEEICSKLRKKADNIV